VEIKLQAVTIKKFIESGHVEMPFGWAFPNVTSEDLRALKRWWWHDLLNEDPSLAKIQMYWHSYVLQLNGKNFLIDACVGNRKRRPFDFLNDQNSPYLDNLAGAGLKPEQIDYVLCTHLHHDHVGWFTKLENGQWVPTFRNAKYVLTRADYDLFSDYHGEDPCQRPAFYDSILPIVEHGLAELVETDHRIEHGLSGDVWLQGVAGHTPGNCVIHAGSGGRSTAIFTGDVFHHPVEILRPLTPFKGDEDRELGAKNRAAFFMQYAGTGATLFPAHFFAGKVERDEDGYRYELVNGSQRPINYWKHI
jgi:glyoxylase-like metal-dependent hydrolase (beta-lactamase superfamily II)